MEEDVMQLLLTARIGDGYIIRYKHTGSVYYSSILKDYIDYKHDVLSKKYKCKDVQLCDNSAGFNKNGIIYKVTSNSYSDMLEISNMSRLDVIKQLDYFGFMIYLFDDGSYHKAHGTIHLYCNSFTEEEVEALKTKIFELFPFKVCCNRIDKKKSGKQYPYLYIPKVTAIAIVNYYKDFLLNTPKLHCMLYKLGQPSQTIEKQ